MMFLAVLLAAPLGAQGAAKEPQGIPPAHRPPPGMCRIWIDGVPPDRQPAPTDCATAIRRRPPNARVIFGDDYREAQRRTLVPSAPLRGDDSGRADRERADRERAEAESAARERQQHDKHDRDRTQDRTPPPRREAHPRNGKPPFGG
jgi:hypothetical protein